MNDREFTIRVYPEKPLRGADEDFVIYPIDDGPMSAWWVDVRITLSSPFKSPDLAGALGYVAAEIEALIDEGDA